jgi:hypothetical protein
VTPTIIWGLKLLCKIFSACLGSIKCIWFQLVLQISLKFSRFSSSLDEKDEGYKFIIENSYAASFFWATI